MRPLAPVAGAPSTQPGAHSRFRTAFFKKADHPRAKPREIRDKRCWLSVLWDTSRAQGHIRAICSTYGEIPYCDSSCMAQQKRLRSTGLIGLSAGSLHNRTAASAHCHSHVHISEECCYQSQSGPSVLLLPAVRTPVWQRCSSLRKTTANALAQTKARVGRRSSKQSRYKNQNGGPWGKNRYRKIR